MKSRLRVVSDLPLCSGRINPVRGYILALQGFCFRVLAPFVFYLYSDIFLPEDVPDYSNSVPE